MAIVLSSSSGSLTLTPDESGVDGWCQVHLITSAVRRPLGAERLNYVAAQLLSFLSDASPDQHWVFSLSELHTSAYGKHVGEEAILELQDAHAHFFAKLVLTAAEKHQWVQELSQYNRE
jgi:hypothetical protein